MTPTETQVPFLSIHLGDILTVIVIVIMYLTFRIDRKKKWDAEQADRDRQVAMHVENRNHLDRLLEFKEEQLESNKKSDAQLHELSTQTALLTQLAANMDTSWRQMVTTMERRLQRLEDQQDRGI